MKFRVERDVLADAAAWVARSLPARPPVPVLGGVLIEAVSGRRRRPADRLRVRLRDLGPGRAGRDDRRPRPGAGVRAAAGRHHPGAAVQAGRPGRRRVPGHDQLRQQPVQPADHAGRGLPAAAGDAAAAPARSPADRLAEAVGQVAVAAGRDDTLPMLTGVRLEIEGTRLTLAATDRFRLAVRELDWSPEDAEQSSRGADPGPHAGRGGQDARRCRHRRARAVRGRRHARRSPAAAGAPPPGCWTPSSRGSAS